jgi:hypothetical protein
MLAPRRTAQHANDDFPFLDKALTISLLEIRMGSYDKVISTARRGGLACNRTRLVHPGPCAWVPRAELRFGTAVDGLSRC